MRYRWLALALFFALAATSAPAEDKKKEKPKAPKPVEAGRVYTQSDLERVIQQAKDTPLTPLPPAQPGSPTEIPAAAPAPAKPKKEAPLSFGNDDLERMYGTPEPAPAGEGAKAADPGLTKLPDPMDEVADWQAQRTAAERRRNEAQAHVKDLEAQVRDLEKADAAVRNPLLPRPEPLPGMEESWDKMSGTERVGAIDRKIDALRAELGKARQDVIKADADLRAAESARSEAKGD